MENENNDYRSRMIDEARQLNERIRKATIYYAQHPDDDLLGLQITIMGSYLHVLTARIEQSEVASSTTAACRSGGLQLPGSTDAA